MAVTTTLKAAEQARQIAEHNLAIKRAEVETIALQRTHKLLESPQPVVVPWTEYPGFDEFDRWPTASGALYWMTSVDDRIGPRYRPFYENELDLRKIRAQARRFEALFPVALGALGALTDYVIG